MQILYIQHAGDFAQAYKDLIIEEKGENYYGQNYSVRAVLKQIEQGHTITVIGVKVEGYDIRLTPALRAIGLGDRFADYVYIDHLLEKIRPELVVLRTPNVGILKLLNKKNIPIFPVFADSFDRVPFWRIKTRCNRKALSQALNEGNINWVANHQINASMSIEKLGFDKAKILPYDWVHAENPEKWRKNSLPSFESKQLTVFYAGSIIVAKGVFDLVKAVANLISRGFDVSLTVAGSGDVIALEALAEKLGIETALNILGLIDRKQVLNEMHSADVVCVPSHHDYPEGLAMTIMESLMVQTPLVVSDHPMFVDRIGSLSAVEVFPAGEAAKLASSILKICSSPTAYKSMCTAAREEWYQLNLELKWADMINAWVEDQGHDFSDYSLGTYD